jgi:hypothetical protein
MFDRMFLPQSITAGSDVHGLKEAEISAELVYGCDSPAPLSSDTHVLQPHMTQEAWAGKTSEIERRNQHAEQQLVNLLATLAGREQELTSKVAELADFKSRHQDVLAGLKQANRRIDELENELAAQQMSSSATPQHSVYKSEPVSPQPILQSARSDPRSNASHHSHVFLAEPGAVQHKIITLARGLDGMVGISYAKTPAGPYTVMELSSQGAAHRSGLLKSGDLIHAIDQQSLYTLDSQQVSKLLTGPPDSILSLVLTSQ